MGRKFLLVSNISLTVQLTDDRAQACCPIVREPTHVKENFLRLAMSGLATFTGGELRLSCHSNSAQDLFFLYERYFTGAGRGAT